jgi:curved DNA-binding protein CbpA
MSAARGAAPTGDERKPRPAPDCDPARLVLSPAEGYLLSRIDGSTSIAQLRQIGGLPADEVVSCVERWLAEGVVVVDGGAGEPSVPPAKRPRTQPPAPDLDESLDLPVETQEAVRAMLGRLGAPYHEVLGVDAAADARTIKKAYFGLSKQFHPDRYFRRELGAFQDPIERIWRRILEAYELLSDPATRAEVQKTGGGATADGPPAPATPAVTSPLQSARRMRARLTTLAGHRKMLEERKRKAKGFFESGMAAFRKERWLEAAGSVRLAIAFDPHNEDYRSAFPDVQGRAHEERARHLLKEADGCFDLGDYRDALKLYEEATYYRPFDAELNHRTGRLAFRLGEDLRKAKEFAGSACELEPECALYHRTLGQIFAAAGLEANARRELQQALRLDPKDAEAKEALRAL